MPTGLRCHEAWELDRHDGEEVTRAREAEFAHAAALLRTSADPRPALEGIELVRDRRPPSGEPPMPPPANGSRLAAPRG